jgi:hypothetical protein
MLFLPCHYRPGLIHQHSILRYCRSMNSIRLIRHLLASSRNNHTNTMLL